MQSTSVEPGGQPAEPFALHQIIDQQHQGVVAAAFEHPAGWQTQSMVIWNTQHVGFPVTIAAESVDPNGVNRFELLPAQWFCWLEPDLGYYQQGQDVLGQIYLRGMSAPDVLIQWFLPRLRGNRPGLFVRDMQPLPGLADRLGVAMPGACSEGARVTVEYQEDGTPVEEEFFGVRLGLDKPYHGPMGVTIQHNWGVARLFSFRAARGELAAQRSRFWRMAQSLQMNPAWEQLREQVTQQLNADFKRYIQQGYQASQAAMQLSRSLSAQNDAWLANFERQRHAAAHTSPPGSDLTRRSRSDVWDETIRGVETFDDPYWGTSQHDSTYRYHWTDGSGNYQYSDDPFFNPNLGSNQNWTLMTPAPH